MKTIHIIASVLGLCLLIMGCEKDNMTIDKAVIFTSVDAKEKELTHALASAPQGWVMMVKGTVSDSAYIPIVMKFDTATNIVRMKSPYGTQKNDGSTFLINRGASGVILNFSGGSTISALMRQGPTLSNITDYQFNVLSVTPDTITIQGIRSGGAFKPEGGAIFKLFKKPESWSWAEDNLKLDLRLPANKRFMNREARMSFKYMSTNRALDFSVTFFPFFDEHLEALQTFADVFYVDLSARVFDPFYICYMFTTEDNLPNTPPNPQEYPILIQGHNSISFRTFQGDAFTEANGQFNNKYKFNYLVFNKVDIVGNNLSMEVAAYDKYGNDYIKGSFTMTP